ncbi:hypothetical protein OROMI_010239 [Orobanche minor]
MSSSSYLPRQLFHLTPADKMILPPPADKSSEYGNQPIDIMYSSKHGIWYYLYRAQPEGSIECGNQVEQPIDITNSSSQAENKGSIECGTQVEKHIDIVNSSSHHPPSKNTTPEGSFHNQVEQPINITLHGKDGHPINLVFSSSNRKWYGLTPDKKLIPSRPWYLCPQSKSAWNFLCGNQDEGQVDIFKKEKPECYKEIVHVCKFALNHYKDSHPDKPSYEFESVEKSYARADAGKSYSLTFKARNVEDGKLALFKTHAHHPFGKELEISKVELLPE